jgi:dephospho-CoA kinase
MIKVCLFGYSGVGKSTCTGLLRECAQEAGLTVTIVKLAKPLYEIQEHFYEAANVSLRPGQQDQVLLETIAVQLRRINPHALVNNMMAHLARSTADVAINDDLRNSEYDFSVLKDDNFRFVRVFCSEDVRLKRLGLRNDLTCVPLSRTHNEIDRIVHDYLIENSADGIPNLRTQIHDLWSKMHDTDGS